MLKALFCMSVGNSGDMLLSSTLLGLPVVSPSQSVIRGLTILTRMSQGTLGFSMSGTLAETSTGCISVANPLSCSYLNALMESTWRWEFASILQTGRADLLMGVYWHGRLTSGG